MAAAYKVHNDVLIALSTFNLQHMLTERFGTRTTGTEPVINAMYLKG